MIRHIRMIDSIVNEVLINFECLLAENASFAVIVLDTLPAFNLFDP